MKTIAILCLAFAALAAHGVADAQRSGGGGGGGAAAVAPAWAGGGGYGGGSGMGGRGGGGGSYYGGGGGYRRRRRLPSLAAAATGAAPPTVEAANNGSGYGGGRNWGGHGGWHGGHYKPGYGGGGWGRYPYWGGGYWGGFWGPSIGFYWGGPAYWGWPYYASGWPYYSAGFGYYGGGYPAVYEQDTTVYVNPSFSSPAAPSNHWYYCTDPAGYFPYVQNCNRAWIPVTPQHRGLDLMNLRAALHRRRCGDRWSPAAPPCRAVPASWCCRVRKRTSTQFQADQMSCQQYASAAIGGSDAAQNAANSAAASAVAGTAIGRRCGRDPRRRHRQRRRRRGVGRGHGASVRQRRRVPTPRVTRTTNRSDATTWRTRNACTRAATSCRGRWRGAAAPLPAYPPPNYPGAEPVRVPSRARPRREVRRQPRQRPRPRATACRRVRSRPDPRCRSRRRATSRRRLSAAEYASAAGSHVGRRLLGATTGLRARRTLRLCVRVPRRHASIPVRARAWRGIPPAASAPSPPAG